MRGDGMPAPLFACSGARAMTLLDRTAPETFRERSTPVLETERLVLRAPRLEDANARASLVTAPRIPENTLRAPRPYGLADAGALPSTANHTDDSTVFLVANRSTGG